MGVRMVEFGKRRKEERRDIFCLGKKKPQQNKDGAGGNVSE